MLFQIISGLMGIKSDPVPHKQESGPGVNDIHFMAVALLFAKKSPDPNTKVGACIVNQEGNIVGVGYNKMPNGGEDKFPWNRDTKDILDNKHTYVCHAELNAIMNKTAADVKGCTIYTTLFPCNRCAKLIIQSGIRSVVFLSNKYATRPETEASHIMLAAAGITQRQFQSKEKLSDLLKSIDPFAE